MQYRESMQSMQHSPSIATDAPPIMMVGNMPQVEEYKGPSIDGPVNLNTLTDIS